MNSKSLKKLALGLTISTCVSSSILYSMDGEDTKQNISDETSIIKTIQSIDLEQEINKFNQLHNNKDYKYLSTLENKITSKKNDCYSK